MAARAPRAGLISICGGYPRAWSRADIPAPAAPGSRPPVRRVRPSWVLAPTRRACGRGRPSYERSRRASPCAAAPSAGSPRRTRPRAELQRLLQRQLAVGDQPHEHVGGRGAHVGQVLLLDGVDVEVLRRGSSRRRSCPRRPRSPGPTNSVPRSCRLISAKRRPSTAAVGDERAGRAGAAARRPTAPSGRRRGA